MSNSRSNLLSCAAALLAVMGAPTHPLAAQITSTQFISNVESAVGNLTASLPPSNPPIIFGGQVIFAHGSGAASWTPAQLIDYVDGLKAAGVQRVEFNPSVTTITNDPAAVANLDAMVLHVRQLGMRLAINPEYTNTGGTGEFPVASFDDFQNMAMKTYPLLVARYQPDNFVIVHEPTTMAARMGISTTPAQWAGFVEAMEPLIKTASPRTLVGAGDCAHCNEDAFFSAFVVIPTCTTANVTSGCLDFMTMDLYSDSATDFTEVEGWAQSAHTNSKGVYMEETFAPHDLGPIPPGGIQSNPNGAEAYSLIGTCDTVFESMDQVWLSGMARFDASYGMEAMTAFTTQAFFLYVTAAPPLDEATNPSYLKEMAAAMQQGQLTATGVAYAADVQQMGIKNVASISNASYATLPTIFNPTCGTADNPCNANSTVAADMIVSAFGPDLANQTVVAYNWPASLGNTTATLLDSSNTSLPVQLYSVAPTQVNYLVPGNAATGPATLTITSGDRTITTGIVMVAPVAPGLYTSFANGQGPASAIAVCAGTCSGWTNSLGNGQFWQYTFVQGCSSGTCTAPISWGANDTLVIELYGSGVRHAAQLSDITAAIGGVNLPVQYAGAQGTDLGLDQINVLIPQSLNGAGQVSLTVTAQDTVNNIGVTSNAVSLDLQ